MNRPTARIRGLLALAAPLIAVAAVLAVWQIVSQSGLVNAAILPPPSEILGQLKITIQEGKLWPALARTLGFFAIGYGAAVICGITVGVAMATSPAVHGLLEPIVELLRPIPKPALIPPLFLLFGIGATSEVILVALAAFFPIVINTVLGIRQIDPVVHDMARTFRISAIRRLFGVTLPSATPMILVGMRVSLSIALVMMVLAEMLAGGTGVGSALIDAQRMFQLPEMYGWVFVLAAIGLLFTKLFDLIEATLVPWRGL